MQFNPNFFPGTAPSSSKNKTTKMMAILMGTYYGFFLPQIINYYIQYDTTIKQYTSAILYLIFFLNPIVNPLIYAWMSPDFNKAFKAILNLDRAESETTRSNANSLTDLKNVCVSTASTQTVNLPQK